MDLSSINVGNLHPLNNVNLTSFQRESHRLREAHIDAATATANGERHSSGGGGGGGGIPAGSGLGAGAAGGAAGDRSLRADVTRLTAGAYTRPLFGST